MTTHHIPGLSVPVRPEDAFTPSPPALKKVKTELEEARQPVAGEASSSSVPQPPFTTEASGAGSAGATHAAPGSVGSTSTASVASGGAEAPGGLEPVAEEGELGGLAQQFSKTYTAQGTSTREDEMPDEEMATIPELITAKREETLDEQQELPRETAAAPPPPEVAYHGDPA